MAEDRKKLAADKLEKAAKISDNMKLIVKHLQKRVDEDEGLADDIADEKKDFNACMKYITEKARKLAKNGCAMVEDSTVFEWAEDYFRATPEDVEKIVGKKTEKKTESAQEKRERIRAAVAADRQENKPKQENSEKPNKVPKADKEKTEKVPKTKDIEGQMSLFDFM